MSATIARAEVSLDLDAVRDLIRDCFRWAIAEVSKTENPSIFASLDDELAGLPGRFGPPTGCLLLARLDGAPAGCIAFYGHDATTMEIKRMFVRPEARGHGIGQRLLEALLAEARVAGYARYVLSSHHTMHHAHAVYRRAGFRDVPCSAEFPNVVPEIDVCMEMIPQRGEHDGVRPRE